MSIMGTALVYIAAIVAANWSAATFGPSATIVNALLLIGLDLTLRDRLHDRWTGQHLTSRMALLIGTASIVTWALFADAGRIAAASAVAFALSASADALVYHAVRRWRWTARANTSNIVGAAVDSVAFPTLAFGGFLPWITAGQFAAKVAGGALWAAAIAGWRVRAAARNEG